MSATDRNLPDAYVRDVEREANRVESALEEQGLDRRRILLVGGAGYVGSVLTDHLLRSGYAVRCLDLLLYDNDFAVLPFLLSDDYEFLRGDMADPRKADQALEGVSDVVILAGLVGDPITKKYPAAAEAVNEDGVKRFVRELPGRNLEKVIFISTCSNYGVIDEDVAASESHELEPLSLYAEAKVEREFELLDLEGVVDFSTSILRFATAFGLSPRMRFDLTVNHFTRALHAGKDLLVYDAETWRPYCHVEDFAVAIRRVLEAPRERVDFEVFNVGSDANNCTKQMIVDMILNYLPEASVTYRKEGEDPRNYRVDFSKLRNRLHFEPRHSVDDGIQELIRALDQGLFTNIEERRKLYGNHEIDYPVEQVPK